MFLDVQSPSVTCPDNITTGLTNVTFTPNIMDNGDPMPTVTYDPLGPGDEFPYGETLVVVTAMDASGNQANCSFIVNVQGIIGSHANVCKTH